MVKGITASNSIPDQVAGMPVAAQTTPDTDGGALSLAVAAVGQGQQALEDVQLIKRRINFCSQYVHMTFTAYDG
jgi:hypothetical protein